MRVLERKPWFQVHILYGPRAAGAAALKLFLRLERRFTADLRFDLSIRAIESLPLPGQAAQGLRELAEADMIMLAPGNGEVFRPSFRRWLEELPASTPSRRRILVLMDPLPSDAVDITLKRRIWLVGLADRKQLDFISSGGLRVPRDPEWGWEDQADSGRDSSDTHAQARGGDWTDSLGPSSGPDLPEATHSRWAWQPCP